MPRLRRKELIELAAEEKAEEDRQAALNALIAGRWIQPKKSWVNKLLYSGPRSDYETPEMTDEEAVERAWELLKADKKAREEKKKKKEKGS